MLKVAFASNDHVHVNQHFGGAEGFIVYDVSPGHAELVGLGEFTRVEHVGSTGRAGLTGGTEDKVLAKLDFLQDCAAVYAVAIGNSSIKRLMKAEIQPIITDNGHHIVDLLSEVSQALWEPGSLSWVDRLCAKAGTQSSDLVVGKAREGRDRLASHAVIPLRHPEQG